MQTQGLYYNNTEGPRPLIDPCQGLDFDETECGKEPLTSLIPLLLTTHRALPIKLIPYLLRKLSFSSDLTETNSLPKGYNKLTSNRHQSMGQGQDLGRLVTISITSLEVELKWKRLLARYH